MSYIASSDVTNMKSTIASAAAVIQSTPLPTVLFLAKHSRAASFATGFSLLSKCFTKRPEQRQSKTGNKSEIPNMINAKLINIAAILSVTTSKTIDTIIIIAPKV